MKDISTVFIDSFSSSLNSIKDQIFSYLQTTMGKLFGVISVIFAIVYAVNFFKKLMSSASYDGPVFDDAFERRLSDFIDSNDGDVDDLIDDFLDIETDNHLDDIDRDMAEILYQFEHDDYDEIDFLDDFMDGEPEDYLDQDEKDVLFNYDLLDDEDL